MKLKKKIFKKTENAYLKLKDNSDALIATRKPIEQFSLKQLTTIIKSYKQNGDAT